MATSLFSQANAAFVDEDYTRAVELYTRALELDGDDADCLVNRAHAFQKLELYAEARTDAARAAQLRPAEPKTHLRQGVACFHLADYRAASDSFQRGLDAGGGADLRQWLVWSQDKLSKLAVQAEGEETLKATPKAVEVKRDWYQTESHVVVTLLTKNVDAATVQCQFDADGVHLQAVLANGTPYELNLRPAHPIAPSHCSYQVLRSKLEVRLKKCDGLRWSRLEAGADGSSVDAKPIPVAAAAAAAAAPTGAVPQYPSSAPKKKDWDKIEVDLKREEAEEKPEGEAALNQLFQKIYSEGSEEVRRAMNKSFQESGGTVLSTNWNEVAKEKLAVKPPDGMEFKKWDQ